jgi:hypothetical protein
MTDTKNPGQKIKTDPFRMSFPWILLAKEDKGDDGKVKKTFQLGMLYPPGTDLTKYKAALAAAMTNKFGADKSKWPNLRHKPADVIRDFESYNAGTKKPLAGDWKGWTMIRANAPEAYPPGVVGPVKGGQRQVPEHHRRSRGVRRPVGARDDRRVPLRPHQTGGKGVTFGLKNLQLLKHDTNFSGAVTAPEEDFDNASDEWAGEADAFDSGKEPAGAKAAE